MKSKKKESVLICSKYLRKVSSHDKIEELSLIIRGFLKELLNLKYELTFREVEEITKRKHIPPEIQEKIILICERLESLEYRPTKPTKKEIGRLKGLVRVLIKESCPEDEKDKKNHLNKVIKKAKKTKVKKQKHADIIKKINKRKEDIKKRIIKKVIHDRIKIFKKSEISKEQKEITHYVNISLGLNMKIPNIKKELKGMGFKKQDIEIVIKKIKGSVNNFVETHSVHSK